MHGAAVSMSRNPARIKRFSSDALKVNLKDTNSLEKGRDQVDATQMENSIVNEITVFQNDTLRELPKELLHYKNHKHRLSLF